jgi:hypothetical protein
VRSGPDDAGVVDEHVKAAGAGHDVPRGSDRRIVGDVHLHEPRAEALGGRGAALAVPRGDPHDMTLRQKPTSCLITEALAGAGDERRRH